MLDRLISGAGALTDRADRFARLFSRRAASDLLGRRPGSVVVAAVLGILAIALVFVGLEATDNPTPRTIAPALGAGDDIGNRTFSTISGGLSSAYVVTYVDDNGNDAQDPGEDETEWFYFLVDPTTRDGVTVRSSRPPHEVFRLETSGTVVEDAAYIADDATFFADAITQLGITLDDRLLLDATVPAASGAPVADLATGLPPDGTAISVSGSRSPAWVPVCYSDPDGNGTCDDDEVESYDVLIYDEASKRAIVVVTGDPLEFTPATFSGMLRRDERAVSEAVGAKDLAFDELGITVSDHYLLDAGATPASAPLAFGLAALCGLAGGIILIGLAGGYLIYRREDRALPARATTLAVGDRIPLRVTGVLRAAGGQVHVREAPADLLRYQTVAAVAEPKPAATSSRPPRSSRRPPSNRGSTLIIERAGDPEGVAVGLGELQRSHVRYGLPLRGARPRSASSPGPDRCSSRSIPTPIGIAPRPSCSTSPGSAPRSPATDPAPAPDPAPRRTRRYPDHARGGPDRWMPGSWTRSRRPGRRTASGTRSSFACRTSRAGCTCSRPARRTASRRTRRTSFYVVRGRGRVTVGDEDARRRHGLRGLRGATVPHRFHDIAERLELLVVFGPAEGDRGLTRPRDRAGRGRVRASPGPVPAPAPRPPRRGGRTRTRRSRRRGMVEPVRPRGELGRLVVVPPQPQVEERPGAPDRRRRFVLGEFGRAQHRTRRGQRRERLVHVP